MPEIGSQDVNIAFDMYGCPNRCRHCWLGSRLNTRLSEDDLRWAVDQFRGFTQNSINIVTWLREPDFSSDYEQLYDLEVELSDNKVYRAEWELLSVWRLAHDENYAPWAKRIGVETCQISFFGTGETNDWFYRRKGAFQDCLTATERLLDAGIKPRWQWFLTKKIIPELGEMLKLVDRLKLRDRVQSLGGEFQLFMHTPSPDGEASKIEYLRPMIDDTASIPNEITESSKRHFGVDVLWHTEAELTTRMIEEGDCFPHTYKRQSVFFFVILGNWDVFTNEGTLDSWWKLGNLKKDSMKSILDNYEKNRTVGLKTIYNIPQRELAERFGDKDGILIYETASDLSSLWVARYCEEIYRGTVNG